jgi:hypothetical protein
MRYTCENIGMSMAASPVEQSADPPASTQI